MIDHVHGKEVMSESEDKKEDSTRQDGKTRQGWARQGKKARRRIRSDDKLSQDKTRQSQDTIRQAKTR
jgi:hypothetical protein